MSIQARRWPLIVGGILVALSIAAFAIFQFGIKALKSQVEQINASLEDLRLPDIKGQSKIAIDGVLKGVQHDGKVSISGPIELASKESELTTRLRGVDLVALQP